MKFLSLLNKKDLKNKICLLRVDFNIKTDAELRTDFNLRIRAILPTLKFLIDNGAKVVILSHRGRPRLNSKLRIKNLELSLNPFAKIISKLFKKPVYFIDFKKGINTTQISKIITRDGIFLLENLRFLAGEEKNDEKLAEKLASIGNFYINDAFSVSHRKNASVVAIAKFLPSYAGLLLEKEIKNLSSVMKKPKKPLVFVLGGAKISDKIGIIKKFQKKADYFLIGGAMANTFFVAQGLSVGESFYEKEAVLLAKKILKSKKIILPVDTVVYKKRILDIGPKTIEKYSKIIKNAKTIIWNGPMGYIEEKRFKNGSEAIVKAILKSKAFTVIGGGETTALLGTINPKREINFYKANSQRVNSKVFISTGGGAMLEYLTGKKLPGIKVLK